MSTLLKAQTSVMRATDGDGRVLLEIPLDRPSGAQYGYATDVDASPGIPETVVLEFILRQYTNSLLDHVADHGPLSEDERKNMKHYWIVPGADYENPLEQWPRLAWKYTADVE